MEAYVEVIFKVRKLLVLAVVIIVVLVIGGAASHAVLRPADANQNGPVFTSSYTLATTKTDDLFVIADTAGKFPYAEEVTADFVYVRLHGSEVLYASGYRDDELDVWAGKIAAWRGTARARRDVYVYFDNDAKVHAPFDAARLRERVPDRVARAASDLRLRARNV